MDESVHPDEPIAKACAKESIDVVASCGLFNDEETTKERKLRLTRERVRKCRLNKNKEEIDISSQKSNEQKRNKRDNEIESESKKRKMVAAEQARNRRKCLKEQQLDDLRAKHTRHMRIVRENESIEQGTARRAQIATHKRSVCENLTIEQAAIRRANNAVQKRRERTNTGSVIQSNSNYIDAEIIEHYCGHMNCVCTYCRSLNFELEKSNDGTFNYCCHKGTVLLETNEQRCRQFPEYLFEILENTDHPHYHNFHENIRSYNSAIAFASMGAQIDKVYGHGPPVFRVHGQIYHRTSHMYPTSGEQRKYAQLYVIDSKLANDDRVCHRGNSKLDTKIIENLDTVIRENNVFAKAYQTLGEVEQDVNRTCINSTPVVSMVFNRDRNKDRRRYNLPTVEEVAMIFRTEDGSPPFNNKVNKKYIKREAYVRRRGK